MIILNKVVKLLRLKPAMARVRNNAGWSGDTLAGKHSFSPQGGKEKKMNFKGNPFRKGSYGDTKSPRNYFEVAAVLLAAAKLGIPVDLVNGVGHNFWVEAPASIQKRLIEEALRFPRKAIREKADKIEESYEDWLSSLLERLRRLEEEDEF